MPYPSHGVLGTASPPSLEQTLGGGSIIRRMAAGTQELFLKGGVSHPHFRLIRRLGCPNPTVRQVRCCSC